MALFAPQVPDGWVGRSVALGSKPLMSDFIERQECPECDHERGTLHARDCRQRISSDHPFVRAVDCVAILYVRWPPDITDEMVERGLNAIQRVRFQQYMAVNPQATGMPGSGGADAQLREQVRAAPEAVLR